MAPRIWLIAGPTASGKSALALRLARETGAEVVGADALQLYRDIPILSAAPSPAERAEVPHHLVGAADAADGWSAGRWQRAAVAAIRDIHERGRDVVVVGGTGLYFSALTQGLAAVPDIPPEARRQAEADYAHMGESNFRERLSRVDPLAAARISASDRQRLVRAWEVAAATGRSLTDWQADAAGGLEAESWRGVVLAPDRAALYARCDARLEAMLRDGVLDEVAALAARGLASDLPAMKAVGFREFAAHLSGKLTLQEALEAAQRETRRYAKRQSTWLRGQARDWPLVEELDGAR